MQQETILLNAGRERDVEPLDQADDFLAQHLGAAPSRPAVPTLRLVQDAEGAPRAGVFIGTTQVGHLPADAGLIATLKACELNGAVARARGTLSSSEDQPGQVRVSISLADSEHLLCDPAPEPVAEAFSTPAAPSAPPARRDFASPGLSASLEDSTGFEDMFGDTQSGAELGDSGATALLSSALDDAATPALSSGYAEDYPDWPPPGIKPTPRAETPAPLEPALVAEPVVVDPVAVTEPTPVEPVAVAEPAPVAPIVEPAFTPVPSAASRPFSYGPLGDEPETAQPAAAAAPTTPAAVAASASPQALLATRTAWMGSTPMPAQGSQSGWLAGSAKPAQDPSPVIAATYGPTGPQTTGALGAAPSAAGGLNSGASSERLGAERSGSRGGPDDEIIAAWSSPPRGAPERTQTVYTADKRAAKSSGMGRTLLIAALALVVLAASAFLVWKFVFAPKTYTDKDYGYSFTYPRGWEIVRMRPTCSR